jgi:hypothetical protein
MPPSPKLSASSARKASGSVQKPVEPAWLRWLERRPIVFLSVATLASLVPFVAKPFHIDDPMYIWAAEHVRHHPLNFYGFDVAWSGHMGPMHMAMQNPPLASFFMTAASLVAGFREIPMHLALFVPAVLLVIGTYQLARQFCRRAAVAGLLTLVTPVFVTCAATVTNDILMVCFWVWAVYWWERGLRDGRIGAAVISALLVSLGCMTKYPAMNLIPLLGAYALLRRAPLKYLLALLIPVLVLVAYEHYTKHLYQRGLLTESMVYSTAVRARRGAEAISKTFVCICFLGGSLAPALFLAPVIWRLRIIAVGAVLIVLATFALSMMNQDALSMLSVYGDYTRSFRLQVAIWSVTGISVLALPGADAWRRRDAHAALLGLWIFGTFVFAGIVNWSVNGRTLLPLVPAIAIVMARRLEDMGTWQVRWRINAVGAGLAAALALSMWITLADQCLAQATRNAAERIMAKYGGRGSTIWFQGHWGLQYYMQVLGAKPWVPGKMPLKVNDLMVVPQFNSNATLIREPLASRVDLITEDCSVGASAMNIAMGAGFYSHLMGPLPFVIGDVPEERFLILRINVPAEVKDESASQPLAQ